MAEAGWRIVLVTTVPIVAQSLTAALRDLGHRPVAVISARRDPPLTDRPSITDESAPAGLDVLLPATKHGIEPLLRACQPDLLMCWGFPWKIPLTALQVPRLGSINCHPAMLPRHRGPIPLAWAIREGDGRYGVTWHWMDAELDTGAILAQASVPMEDDDFDISAVGPRMGAIAIGLLPRVLERVALGDPGEPQREDGATWAGHFGEDYATIDWSQPARFIHDQVRAWRFAFALSPLTGPLTELDGKPVRVLRTSLTDPGTSARRMEARDGPIWLMEWEPLPPSAAAS